MYQTEEKTNTSKQQTTRIQLKNPHVTHRRDQELHTTNEGVPLPTAGLSNGWERRHRARRSVRERERRLPLLQASQKSDGLLQSCRQHA